MSALPKRKLCWNCDGNIALDEEHCSFCGVFQDPYGEGSFKEAEAQGSTVYPFQQEEGFTPHLRQHQPPEASEPSMVISEALLILKPLLLLMVGAVLALFAFLLFCFGSNGVFTLQWRTDLWYLYLALGLPALYVGWNALNKLPVEPIKYRDSAEG